MIPNFNLTSPRKQVENWNGDRRKKRMLAGGGRELIHLGGVPPSAAPQPRTDMTTGGHGPRPSALALLRTVPPCHTPRYGFGRATSRRAAGLIAAPIIPLVRTLTRFDAIHSVVRSPPDAAGMLRDLSSSHASRRSKRKNARCDDARVELNSPLKKGTGSAPTNHRANANSPPALPVPFFKGNPLFQRAVTPPPAACAPASAPPRLGPAR